MNVGCEGVAPDRQCTWNTTCTLENEIVNGLLFPGKVKSYPALIVEPGATRRSCGVHKPGSE